MMVFVEIFLVVLLALALVGWLAERNNASARADRNSKLSLLPGDIKYESPNGNVRVYFPITTSIVVSLLLTLVLRIFG